MKDGKKEPKNSHIVPKVYLERFTKLNRKLFKLRLDIKKRPNPREFYPSEVCYKPYFYKFEDKVSINSEVANPNILEEQGFLYENRLGKLIDKLVKQSSTLNFQEAFDLSAALFDIKMRNEHIRNAYLSKDNLAKTFDSLIADHKTSPDRIEPLLKKNNVSFEEFLNIFEKLKTDWITDESVKKYLHNRFLLDNKIYPSETKQLITASLAIGNWTVMTTTLDNQFITSDNPGYCHDNNDKIHNTKFGDFVGFFFPPIFDVRLLFVEASPSTLWDSRISGGGIFSNTPRLIWSYEKRLPYSTARCWISTSKCV